MSQAEFLKNVRDSDKAARRAGKLLKGLQLFMGGLSAAGVACDFAEGFGGAGFGAEGFAAGVESALEQDLADVVIDSVDQIADVVSENNIEERREVNMSSTSWVSKPVGDGSCYTVVIDEVNRNGCVCPCWLNSPYTTPGRAPRCDLVGRRKRKLLCLQ